MASGEAEKEGDEAILQEMVSCLIFWCLKLPLAVLMLSAFIDCFCLACTYVRPYMHDSLSLSFSPVYCQWFEL